MTTLSDLETAVTDDGVTLTPDEARALVETYTDACEQCHTLIEERARERAAFARQLAARDREIARLTTQAEAHRVALAAALTPKAAA